VLNRMRHQMAVRESSTRRLLKNHCPSTVETW
jgi:hypothetical protein